MTTEPSCFYLCRLEVELALPLGLGMTALLKSKMSPHVIRDCLLHARRFSGEEAERLSLVDRAVKPEDLLATAIELAQKHAKHGVPSEIYAQIKADLYTEPVALLYPRQSKL